MITLRNHINITHNGNAADFARTIKVKPGEQEKHRVQAHRYLKKCCMVGKDENGIERVWAPVATVKSEVEA